MKDLKGHALYQFLVDLSGLAKEEITPLLDRLLGQMNLKKEDLTEANVRELMMIYLEELNEMFETDTLSASPVEA